MANGSPVAHYIGPGVTLHPTTYQLDGNATTANYFGRRNYRTGYSHFEPDQAGGCQFQGSDIPGISGGSGTALTVNLDFRGELIDTCAAGSALATSNWSVRGSGTVPDGTGRQADPHDQGANDLAAATVMTEIRRTGAQWQVTVSIARPPGEIPIRVGDVEVQLFDADGPARLASAPLDEWVEAGDAAGTTASGSFTFEARDGQPTLLRITWDEAVVEAPVERAVG